MPETLRDEIAYWTRREHRERLTAERARCEQAVMAHCFLAERYAARASALLQSANA
jgi:hypothetical protein